MGIDDEKSSEPGLFETGSGPRQGQVTNLEDIVKIPSRWRKIHGLSEMLGAETIGCQQLPEEARDVNQKPQSESSLIF